MSWRGIAFVAGLALLATACGKSHRRDVPSVVVLGFDGMDHELTTKLLAEGKLPNLARLAKQGGFQPLATAVPPQSPVAWSNFITGMDAGGHGIFDFIHRDPKTMLPYLSTSETEESSKIVKIGKYQFPLAGGAVTLLRQGKPFWEVLEERGVETTVVRMPANFPPSGTATHELSGMGTPDLTGTPGTFSFYTTELFAYYGKQISGGEVHEVFLEGGAIKGELYGPTNPFLLKPTKAAAPFVVYPDPEEDRVEIVLGEEVVEQRDGTTVRRVDVVNPTERRILQLGEWSDWVPVDFQLIPTQSIRGICRFYLQAVRPELKLFVSPINIDPLAPALPISTPPEYAAELAEASGRYYTQQMPEDTKAYKEGFFTPQEFMTQAHYVNDTLTRQFEHVLKTYQGGLLFYYFGGVDQVSHMMWRTLDPGHPGYKPEIDAPMANVIPDLYQTFDRIVGMALERAPKDALVIVMSDHGFASWRRAFNLNTWLKEQGYLTPLDPNRKNDPGYFANFDWSRTRAYGFGLNGLYINLRGRERDGIVDSTQRLALMKELEQKLLATIDPATGQHAVTRVYLREDTYQDGGYREIGPDIQVGYAKGTRISNESATGALTEHLIDDNLSAWSGDHCMDHEAVPGVLFTNRPLKKKATSLKDLAAAVLAEYGVEAFPTANR